MSSCSFLDSHQIGVIFKLAADLSQWRFYFWNTVTWPLRVDEKQMSPLWISRGKTNGHDFGQPNFKHAVCGSQSYIKLRDWQLGLLSDYSLNARWR